MSGRERELWGREQELKSRFSRCRAVEARLQERWAQLEERSKALDQREQSLVSREKQCEQFTQNKPGIHPQAEVASDSERGPLEQIREVASAACCTLGAGKDAVKSAGVDGVPVNHGNHEVGNFAGHSAYVKGTDNAVEVKTETDEICITSKNCLTSEAVRCGDTQETDTVGPLPGNPGASEPPVDSRVAENAEAGVQDGKVTEPDSGTTGVKLENLPLNVRIRRLKGNKRRKMNGRITPEGTEDQVAVPAQNYARDQAKARGKCVNSVKQKVSIEVALQEDAPGLLESLRERGLADDLRLFGDSWENELDSVNEETEGFADLENVVSKLWSNSGLIHVQPPCVVCHSGGKSKPYCLGCLSTLMEQAKAMNRQNWPVEWGWCRQVHAFVFVFIKHNRIVLERPEYGYATYFFELIQSISISWQVRRLVTVMSAASVGRAALKDNKALEVGLNLSQEEADILEGYGWSPNCGIATLLNFCDRVVHDYNRDGDSMEWKVKIGKLLMDGYDHGSLLKDPPRRLRLTTTTSSVQPNGCSPVQPGKCSMAHSISLTHVKVEVTVDRTD